MKKPRSGLALVAALLLTVIPASRASAHSLGGRFPYTRGQWLYLPYTAFAPYSYYPYEVQAASNWYNTPTRMWPYRTADYNISRLDFYQGNYGTAWWGLTIHHPCSGSGCVYVYADLYLNQQSLGSESANTRTKVATHEMGHGLELAHPAWWDTAIMQQGYVPFTTPRNHDINDVNIDYPYS